MIEIKNILIDLGLTDNEASVYLAALKLGPTTIANISLESDVKRSTVYGCTDSLLQKGLLYTDVVNKRKRYISEDPKRLFAILERKKAELTNLLPLLSQDYLKSASNVNCITQYKGIDSIKSLYDDILCELTENDEYLVISDHQKWYQLDENYFKLFLLERAKLKLDVRLLLRASEKAKSFYQNQTKYNTKIKLLPADTSLGINMIILPHKTIYMQICEPLQATVVEDIHITGMNRQLFHLLWQVMP